MIFLNKEKGTAIIITFSAMTVLLLLGFYFLNFALTEARISKSHEKGLQAYYLAEAGINEGIWRLNNNEEWNSSFIDPAKNPYQDGIRCRPL